MLYDPINNSNVYGFRTYVDEIRLIFDYLNYKSLNNTNKIEKLNKILNTMKNKCENKKCEEILDKETEKKNLYSQNNKKCIKIKINKCWQKIKSTNNIYYNAKTIEDPRDHFLTCGDDNKKLLKITFINKNNKIFK